MKIGTNSFRGMAPRIAAELLPDNAAQRALNARLLSGNLEAWKRPLLTKQLSVEESGPVSTIYLLGEEWLSWQQEVEVARGTILGDTDLRTYITGLDVPRFTTLALATTGPEPYPVVTRPLGVPAPDDVPALAVTAEEAVEGNITIVNPSAETGDDTGWTQTTPDLAVFTDGDVPGIEAFVGTRWFYGGTNASGEYFQAIDLEDEGVINGQQLTLTWAQASGPAGSRAQMGLRFFDGTATQISEQFADMVAITPTNTWQQRSVTAQVPTGTESVRLVMKFENVGGGTTDAYLDGLALDAADADYTSDGSDLSQWTVSPNNGGGVDSRNVDVYAYGGAYGSVFRMNSDELMCYVYKAFPFDRAATFLVEYDLNLTATDCNSFVTIGGLVGFGEGFGIRTTGVTKRSFNELDDSGSSSATLATFSGSQRPNEEWVRVSISGARSGTTGFDCTITITNKDTGVVLLDAAETTLQITGTELLLKYRASSNSSGFFGYYDNILVRVTPAPATDEAETTLTSYLYRYVNDFGEASAPSLPTRTIQRSDGVVVTVTTDTLAPSGFDDYGITFKQIYRLATGAAGTVFRFVAEIPLAQADYVDTLTDAELGEALDSEDWDLPPEDLRYILALPNGIMVGASKNQLCLSVRNRPHAWPVAWRLPTDTDITGLANVDTSVVIGTQNFVYTASGNDPSSYSMSKPGAPHACLSHRSMAYLLNLGAVFAGADGLMVVNGPTSVSNLTETLFTSEQWLALNPASMHGVAHDDIYFFFYDNGVQAGGYALDMKGTGFGLIELGFHASAVHVDPELDALFMVLDTYEEPSDDLLPGASGGFDLVGVDGRTIFQFNAGEDLMRYLWQSKTWLLPHPMALQWMRVRARSHDDLASRIIVDETELQSDLVLSNEAFRLDARADYDELSVRLVGTSTVRLIECADDVQELM